MTSNGIRGVVDREDAKAVDACWGISSESRPADCLPQADSSVAAPQFGEFAGTASGVLPLLICGNIRQIALTTGLNRKLHH
jgi:hypothetical protein